MMRKPFALILSAVCAALCGCGGGEGAPAAPAPRVIAFYGDSLTFGSINGPAGTLTRLAVPPVRRAQDLLGDGALCVDLSLPGATVADALAGAAMMPFGRFADHVKTTRASVLVVRYGGADAVRGTPLPDFERDLSAMVNLAQAAGKTVLLVGVIATPGGATDAYDLAVERTADALGLGFVDVRSVPFALPDDLADGVHPAQAWSDRITAAIVRHLNSPQP
jgi:acyl-CoA thioesterase-1